MNEILGDSKEKHEPPKKKIAFIEKIKEKIRQNKKEHKAQREKEELEKKQKLDEDAKAEIKNSLNAIDIFNSNHTGEFENKKNYYNENNQSVSVSTEINSKNPNNINSIYNSGKITRDTLRGKRITATGLQKISTKRQSSYFIPNFSKTLKYSKEVISNPISKILENKILVGFCYAIVENFETKEFNMKRLKSLDFNELKMKLNDCKIEYKKLNKDERKDYVSVILEVSNKWKDIAETRFREFREKGKGYYFFKIANNTLNTPKFSLYCDFTDEDIENAFRCVINKWDFPPLNYYEKLAYFSSKTDDFLNDDQSFISNSNNQNLKLINTNCFRLQKPIKMNSDLLDSGTVNANKIGKNSSSNLSNNININEFTLRKRNSINPKKFSILNGGLIHHLNKKNLSFINICEDLNLMTTEAYLREVYLELIENKIQKYSYEKNMEKSKITGQWIYYEEFLKNFDKLVLVYKKNSLKKQKIFDLNWYNYQNDLYNLDKENKVYLINLKTEIIEKINPEPVLIEINNKVGTKNIPQTNKKTPLLNVKEINIPKEIISENKNINLNNQEENLRITSRKNSGNIADQNRSIIVEFTPNNGNFGDFIQEINFYIIFDIYEILWTNTNKSNNLETPKISNENKFISISNFSNNDNNQELPIGNNNIKESKNLKKLCENVSLSGFYSIFKKDIFQKDKEYLLIINSSFTPFGYNLKFFTETGTIEQMNYDKYLNLYGDLKIINFYKFSIPNLEADHPFLLAKFSMKFLNNNVIKNKHLKLKFSLTVSQDWYLHQFIDLSMQVNSRLAEENKDLKNSEMNYQKNYDNKLIFGEVINISLKDLIMEDEIIVRIKHFLNYKNLSCKEYF